MSKSKNVKQAIAPLHRNETNSVLVNSYDNFDWEQLLSQEPASQAYLIELIESDFSDVDTDRDYIRCN
jgi:asparagine synthetase A